MANTATALLILDAKDNASARVKTFGGAVQEAGQKVDKTSVQTAKLGANMTGMIGRVQAAQAPLRNLSAILGGFGLSFLGISAATMALRGMVSSVIQNQQSLIGAQLNMRRWGLSVDDATRLTNTFSAVLGRTAGTTLAAISEEMANFLLAFGPEERAEILKWANNIEKASGGLITAEQALKDTAEAERKLGTGKGIAQLKERGEAAAASIPEVAKSYERGMNVINTALVTLGEGFVRAFDPIFHKRALGEIGSVFTGFGNWIRDDWSKGLEIDMQAPIPKAFAKIKGFLDSEGPNLLERFKTNIANIATWFNADYWANFFKQRLETNLNTIGAWIETVWGPWLAGIFANLWGEIISFGVNIWAGFLGFWIKLGHSIADFWVDKWTSLAEWWGKLTTGIGNFWRGIWEGMKGVAISVYNFIVDRLNDALSWANSVIRLINSALGKVGLSIPEISLRIARATIPIPEIISPAPTFTAPMMAPAGGGPSTFIIQIGDKRLAEIIVDTLTGEVRQKELSE